MPRPKTSAKQVRANCANHGAAASAAAFVIAKALEKPYGTLDADNLSAIADAAKTLEASGCYIRRAVARETLG